MVKPYFRVSGSHLLDYLIDKIMSINTTISDIKFDMDIDKDGKSK